eukprot:m.30640 g.30640  ORF g.30640 m.30640 type:complete len:97 (+) comp6239_c0_seq1:93-383(+)
MIRPSQQLFTVVIILSLFNYSYFILTNISMQMHVYDSFFDFLIVSELLEVDELDRFPFGVVIYAEGVPFFFPFLPFPDFFNVLLCCTNCSRVPGFF